MLDRKRLYKKVLLALISHPVTLCPFMAGATLLIGVWALSLKAGIWIFAAICLMLIAVGTFLTRLLVGSENIVKNAMDEMQKEAQDEREKALDELETKLKLTPGKEDEEYLKALRRMTSSFKDNREWLASRLNAYSAVEIVSKVEELFSECVKLLQETVELWLISKRIGTTDAKIEFLEQRKTLLKDVGESVKELATILAQVPSIATGLAKDKGKEEKNDSNLARLRESIKQSIEIAKKASQRVRDFERGYDIPDADADTRERQ